VEKYLPLLQKYLQKTLRRKITRGRKCLERHYKRIFHSWKDRETFSTLSPPKKKYIYIYLALSDGGPKKTKKF